VSGNGEKQQGQGDMHEDDEGAGDNQFMMMGGMMTLWTVVGVLLIVPLIIVIAKLRLRK
jgi:dolichyl-phosphate-mannose--protein O-mannosyl transferase